MEYTKLGRTGLDVSRICLGCMSYGGGNRGNHAWSLDEEEGRPFFKRALEAGINFFDTANRYSLGNSEEILGRAVREMARREELVIATKVRSDMRKDDPNGSGLSRKAIMAEIDNSLRRLAMDHVDLYQIHRWDYDTPIEETMEALHDVVKSGKVRYIGASSMYAYQFVQMQAAAELHGWTRFVSMQNLYNLAWREEEREMNAYCAATGVGLIPWSPLGGGFLARDRREAPQSDTARRSVPTGYSNTAYNLPQDYKVIDALVKVSRRRGKPMAQVALAWLLSRPGLTAPIVGATRLPQLEDALAAVSVQLEPEDFEELDRSYTWNRQLGLLR
ncbi:MAG TPA: aldo/keto reductase [Burkholderiales bacterium]|nr:aldo/keto reductase [Burkholderiales bacterium]